MSILSKIKSYRAQKVEEKKQLRDVEKEAKQAEKAKITAEKELKKAEKFKKRLEEAKKKSIKKARYGGTLVTVDSLLNKANKAYKTADKNVNRITKAHSTLKRFGRALEASAKETDEYLDKLMFESKNGTKNTGTMKTLKKKTKAKTTIKKKTATKKKTNRYLVTKISTGETGKFNAKTPSLAKDKAVFVLRAKKDNLRARLIS